MGGAAVVDLSIASGELLVSGAESIIVNNHPLGYLSSVNAGGVAVVAGATNVKAENKQASRVGDVMADGGSVTTGSEDVFIGDDIEKDTPVGRAMSNGDEIEVFVPGGGAKYIASQVAAGTFSPRDLVGLARSSTVVPKSADATPPKAQGPVTTDCGDLHEQLGNYPGELIDKFPLTSNYTLGSITRKPYVIFDHALRTGHSGLTLEQIVCNLKLLTVNCIEPIKAQFPNMFITNSWRPAEPQYPLSQHARGQAFDMQFRKVHPKDYLEISQWIRDNIPYDQFLLEYQSVGTRLPWLHLSFTSGRNRRQVMTFLDHSVYSQGLTQLA